MVCDSNVVHLLEVWNPSETSVKLNEERLLLSRAHLKELVSITEKL
jgi:hypothetical protein